MIDPVSAIGMATAAYRGIKSAIDTGKNLHDMAGTLQQWAGAMSDLDFAHRQAENPPMFKKIFGASQVEQNALEVWGHQQRQKKCVKNYVHTLVYFTDLQHGKKLLK